MLFVGILIAILTSGFAQDIAQNFVCDGVKENTFVRNVANCSSWIRCERTNPVIGFCPNQFNFNPLLQVCDYPENVACFSCPPSPRVYFEPVENSCNRFIRCVGGVPSEQICDIGTLFNPTTRQCDYEADVACQTTTPTPAPSVCPTNMPPGQLMAFHDATNCSIGTVCYGGKEERIECDARLHFNTQRFMCVLPLDTNCNIKR